MKSTFGSDTRAIPMLVRLHCPPAHAHHGSSQPLHCHDAAQIGHWAAQAQACAHLRHDICRRCQATTERLSQHHIMLLPGRGQGWWLFTAVCKLL